MSELEAIKNVTEPGTRQSLARDFRRLGLVSGQTVLVHSSLSALGYVVGSPVAVIQALLDVLTTAGTLVMPAHSGDYSDPALWENPPVPEAWQETIRQTMPLYDPRRTPTRGLGRMPELFRTWPDVLRSSHPQMSFAAWGKQARFVTEGHELAFGFGETSPLARVYDLDGHVLLIGAGYDSNTSLHLAECRAPDPPLTQNGAPLLEDGKRIWKTFPEIDYQDDLFPEIGRAYEGQNDVIVGQVAAATCRLMSQRTVVVFGAAWLDVHRHSSRAD